MFGLAGFHISGWNGDSHLGLHTLNRELFPLTIANNSFHKHLTLVTCHSCFPENCTGQGNQKPGCEGAPGGRMLKTTGFHSPFLSDACWPQEHSPLQRSHLRVIGKFLEDGTWGGFIIWILYLSLKQLWKDGGRKQSLLFLKDFLISKELKTCQWGYLYIDLWG